VRRSWHVHSNLDVHSEALAILPASDIQDLRHQNPSVIVHWRRVRNRCTMIPKARAHARISIFPFSLVNRFGFFKRQALFLVNLTESFSETPF
jgi:hypothetical protein